MKAQRPIIVGFVSNLLYVAKIEAAARVAGFVVNWIDGSPTTAVWQPIPDGQPEKRVLGEPLAGEAGELIEKITGWGAALLIFDLENQHIPWRNWLATLKSVPATRRIPTVCFGPHVRADLMDEARQRGAETVLARSAFLKDLPSLLTKTARVLDEQVYAATCQESLSPAAVHGLALFNAGKYFEAHEELEIAWNEETSIGRELYRAILQVAVAYLQIERGNFNGAQKMFLRMRQWINPLPDICRGVEVGTLRADAGEIQQEMLRLGPERIAEFDRRKFKPVIYHKP